ncbi:ADP-ribose pyrophosphatase YjhB, NUDIX family [Natronoarchaeum philippinense]|uniref:ADP-ribose pyrophosphatase YjhB, NUDIX family n=1 Tax=Natronoarchaeum philippinense TaxID=558529 RepID=A0A285N081_NATPI|nr:NUDIX domain-containing protein [Natronoarchaeum philippinense]SNZ02842.1 ADP-ribose pyrophosphatase YjhB, NUDIX family [Natronoarchaeum philippinense]
METTRHFVATVYVVNDGATALHEHDKLDMWLPPGGHLDRDELPHEAAIREAREETGLDISLLASADGPESETASQLPQPRQFLLEDINVTPEGVGHQHVDFVYYGEATHRDITPSPGEQDAADWEWFEPADLRARADELADDVVEVGLDAIEAVDGSR